VGGGRTERVTRRHQEDGVEFVTNLGAILAVETGGLAVGQKPDQPCVHGGRVHGVFRLLVP
jgi:hypothetical protein